MNVRMSETSSEEDFEETINWLEKFAEKILFEEPTTSPGQEDEGTSEKESRESKGEENRDEENDSLDEEEIKVEEQNSNSDTNETTFPNEQGPAFDTSILHPQIDTLIDLTDEQSVVGIKVEKVEKVIVVDNPCEKNVVEEQLETGCNKTRKTIQNVNPESSVSTNHKETQTSVKVEPVDSEDDIFIKVEKDSIATERNVDGEDKVLNPTSQLATVLKDGFNPKYEMVVTKKQTHPLEEVEDGEVIDDDDDDISSPTTKTKCEPLSQHLALVNPASSDLGIASFNNGTLAHELFKNQVEIARSLAKLSKCVSERERKHKSSKKKSKKKSKPKAYRTSSSSSRSSSQSSSESWSRSRSCSRFRSRSRSRFQSKSEKSWKKTKSQSSRKKVYYPKQYRSRSPSSSPLRGRGLKTYKNNSCSNKRSRLRSCNLSISPPRKKYSGLGKRSPSASPPRRRYSSSSSSSSTVTSSSSPRHSRRQKCRSRSRTPKESQTIQSSKNISSCNVTKDQPSTSQKMVLEQKTYQEIRLGCSVMTKQATVTTSYKEELKCFKNALANKELVSSIENDSPKVDCEENKLKVTVFNQKERDVTNKRPDGDLDNPFFIHPEEVELYQTKGRKGLNPVQILNEICIRQGWGLPDYVLLPTSNGFRYGMSINNHKFTTEKTAHQKKLAKAAAAVAVLQWMKILDVSHKD